MFLSASFAVAAALPGVAAAQLGGTIDLHSGPVAWDQSDARDPLLSGEIRTSYKLRPILGLRPELLGEFGLSSGPEERAAVRWDFGARLHTDGTAGGVWLGAAMGGAGTGSPTSKLTRLEGGVRRALGPARVNVWLSRTGFGVGLSGRDVPPDTSLGVNDSLPRKGVSEYTDLGSRLTLRLSRYELGLSLVRRIGGGSIRRNGWELSGTWWVAPSVGVIGAAGHSLHQFGLTLPGGRYGTVGLRLALGAESGGSHPPRKTVGRPSAAPMLTLAGRRLTVRWAAAKRAEIMGDFTEWKPQVLPPSGAGRWTLPLELRTGVHHFNVRFDGGAWLVPAGVSAVDDGFGGRVGLLVVR